MKTLKFILGVLAGVLIALLYAGMIVLFIQKGELSNKLNEIILGADPASQKVNTQVENPTKKPYVNATACDPLKCILPNCRCSGKDIPGSLPKSNTPQMIIFMMDGGINANNLQIYKDLFDNAKNPNNCPVVTTFYVSGDNTDYNMVKDRAQKGFEIADLSVTRRNPNTWWTNANRQQLEQEILDQRTALNIKSGAVTYGWRNPFLSPVETTYQILYENDFLYDSSLGTGLSDRWWPFTLDYLPSVPCYLGNCPKNQCNNLCL
ncbi:chitin deacetylase 7-like [Hydra vulgaris]|uniref:Chitin deacetylase 7-like n=1 Tax=Hydra vulgaris TaxID=6087 RepID=A0ABM4DMJ6_HYDVU